MTKKKENKGEGFIRLGDIQSRSKYHAPEGYFSDLQKNITNEIVSENQSPKRKQNYWWLAASIILVSFTLFYFLNDLNQDPKVNKLIAQVSDEAIIAYLVESEIGEEEITRWGDPDLSAIGNIPDLKMTNDEAEEILELYAL